MAIIYKITNDINNKIYIGETVRTLSARWNQHLSKARNGEPGHLYEAMRYYGENNFHIEQIATCLNKERFEVETDFILKHNSLEPNGYNWLLYQCGPNKYCEDVILQDWQDGLSIVAISEKRHIGVKTASAILKSIGVTQQDIYDRRAKNIGKNSSKAVIQYNLKGEQIAVFPSASEAARYYGHTSSASISKSCCGDLITAHGFIWQYVNSDNIEEIILNSESKKIGKRNKKIIQKTLDGQIIKVYESASAAGRQIGKTHANIARAARDSATAYGFLWEYQEGV